MAAPADILEKVEEGVLRLNQYLGYDLNTVEFAIRDGVPVAIDFCNPAPDAEASIVGQDNFRMGGRSGFRHGHPESARTRARADNLSWGKFLQAAVNMRRLRSGLEPRRK